MSTTHEQGGAVARVLTENEISRRSFLRGTGLVIGLGVAAPPRARLRRPSTTRPRSTRRTRAQCPVRRTPR